MMHAARMLLVSGAIVVATARASALQQNAGVLDLTFGHGGWAECSFDVYRSECEPLLALGSVGPPTATTALPDGGVLVAGSGKKGQLVLERFRHDGMLDPSLGGVGRVDRGVTPCRAAPPCPPPLAFRDVVVRIAVQPSGRILVATSLAIARFTPDGALDGSFGTAGKIGISGILGVDTLADGGFFVLTSVALQRFTPDGQPDASFAGGAFMPGEGLRFTRAIAMPDGGALLSELYPLRPTVPELLLRLTAAGTADATFGTDGTVTPDRTVTEDRPISALLPRDDGGAFVAVQGGHRDSPTFRVFAIRADGSMDRTFDAAAGLDLDGELVALARQPDGNLVLMGSFRSRPFAAMRLLADGTGDPAFGAGGLGGIHEDELPPVFAAEAGAVDPDDNVVLVRPGGDSFVAVRLGGRDTLPPLATITSAPRGCEVADTATVAFRSNESPQRFECAFDDEPFAACSSPAQREALPDGAHRFAVRAVDAAGNRQPVPAAATWTTDAVPPDTTITSGPTRTTHERHAVFTFEATKAASFECSFDGSAYARCASPHNYPALTAGDHLFQVRAVSCSGRRDPTPAFEIFTVLPRG